MKIVLFLLSLASAVAGFTQNWPGFRGDGPSRLGDDVELPTAWSDDEHIAWTVDLPGYGQSSPVIWGETVYITSTDGAAKESLMVEARSLATGEAKWTKKFDTSLKIESSDMVSKAAPTPAVDAERVYAFFESGDLIALSHSGEEFWRRSLTADYGAFQGMHGLGSSPAQTPDALIVLAEHDGAAYLISIDKRTGENRWKIDRDPRVSWSSPIVSGNEILISSNGIAEARNAADGAQIWVREGIEGNTVASPSLSGDGKQVVIGSSTPRQSQALDRATGKPLWTTGATSSFGSPLVYGGLVYFVNRAGALQCVDSTNGELLWEIRLPGTCWASPMAAGGKIHCFTKDGPAVVFEPSREEPGVMTENRLTALMGDRVYGFAATKGSIVVKTGTKMVCIRDSKF